MYAVHINKTKEEVLLEVSPYANIENDKSQLIVAKANNSISAIIQKFNIKTELDYYFLTMKAYLEFHADKELNLVYFPLQYSEVIGELKYAIRCVFISVLDTQPTSFMFCSSKSFEDAERVVMNILTLNNRCKVKLVK